MYCDFQTSELSAYVDGELSGEKRKVVEHHVEQCAECREVIRDMQHVHKWVLQTLEAEVVSTDLQPRVLSAVSLMHQSVQAKRVLQLYTWGLVVVFAAVVWGILASPVGRLMEVFFRLGVAAGHSSLRLLGAVGFTWSTVIIVSSVVLCTVCAITVFRMLKPSEVVL